MKRILLKLSGQSLGSAGFSSEKAQFLVHEIIEAKRDSDIQIAIVIGGGNIWRGRDSKGFSFHQADSDAIGMSATELNASVLQRALSNKVFVSHVFSPASR